MTTDDSPAHKETPARKRRALMLRLLGMRLLTRFLLLVSSISLVSLLFLGRCGLNLEETLDPGTGASVGQSVNYYIQLLQQREDENKAEVDRLTAEIKSLKLQLLQQSGSVNKPSSSSGTAENAFGKVSENGSIIIGGGDGSSSSSPQDCANSIRRQVTLAEIKHGVSLNNEYEVIAFNHFTFSRVYPVDLGLGKRVVEKPIGFKRKDLLEALVRSLDVLNQGRTGKSRYTLDDFIEGVYRTEPTTGTQYEMFFKTRTVNKSHHSSEHGYTKVIVMRPFAPIQTISQDVLPGTKETINIILPLSGRTQTFQGFMEKFSKIAIKNDKHVYLTVVYFGDDGLPEIRTILSKVSRDTHFRNLKLLTLNETFSRSKGLRVGAEHWDKPGDVLLFMCDVDIVFSARFLDRCRWNTEPARKVYYPIVFSLYNPHVAYTLQGKEVPAETDQLVISRDTGFWRDFGYGMTCQYRSDFLKVRGFDEDIVGWGGEDVMLYRKYVRSPIKVVRATDPGIFHIWHPKICSSHLTADQYRACIRSRALNEASHAQLGFLAFRDEVSSHQSKSGGSGGAAGGDQRNEKVAGGGKLET